MEDIYDLINIIKETYKKNFIPKENIIKNYNKDLDEFHPEYRDKEDDKFLTALFSSKDYLNSGDFEDSTEEIKKARNLISTKEYNSLPINIIDEMRTSLNKAKKNLITLVHKSSNPELNPQ